MIKLIGLKRMIFLACMVTLNLVVIAAYFLSVGPMLDDVTLQRDTVNGQINELQGKLSNIKADMAYAKENLPKYDELKDKGFFLSQDRFMIGRTMEDLRNKAGIANFSFSVGDVTEIPSAAAAAINYKLINSRIKVEKIISPLDTNVYILAQQMASVFPDFARIQMLDATRTGEVTEESLQDIAMGKPVNFVNAVVEFDWITMVPKQTDTATTPGGAPAGFRGQ